jgi:hypothetical protein
LVQKDKWIYFLLVDHAFEAHGRSGKHEWLLHNYEFVKSHQISPRNFTDLKGKEWHLG